MVTTLWSGLSTGAIYALIAIGYNLTVTTAGVLNFAFAQVAMVGAFVAISGVQLGLPLYFVLPLAALAGTAVATLEERVAIRFLRRGEHAELVTTIGVATALTAATALIWGATAQTLNLFPNAPLTLAGGQVAPNGLVLIAAALVFGVGLHLFNTHAKYGLASLAHAADREATMLRGINVRWLSIFAFAISGALAGAIGPLIAMSTTATPFVAITLAIKGFIALTLGGVGSQLGAIVGGLGLGLIEALANLWIGPDFGDFVVFGVFAVILLVRPLGLFGKRMLRYV
jgi:branched-chain amino acid transport system permease protein